MPEWSNGAVSKTVVPQGTVGSNPTPSICLAYSPARRAKSEAKCQLGVWTSVLAGESEANEVRRRCGASQPTPPFPIQLPYPPHANGGDVLSPTAALVQVSISADRIGFANYSIFCLTNFMRTEARDVVSGFGIHFGNAIEGDLFFF